MRMCALHYVHFVLQCSNLLWAGKVFFAGLERGCLGRFSSESILIQASLSKGCFVRIVLGAIVFVWVFLKLGLGLRLQQHRGTFR